MDTTFLSGNLCESCRRTRGADDFPIQDPELPCAECWREEFVEVLVPWDYERVFVIGMGEFVPIRTRTVTWWKRAVRCCARHPPFHVWEFMGEGKR